MIELATETRATILEMAAEAGVELDPDQPWDSLTEMRSARRTLHQLARTMRKTPEATIPAVSNLLDRLDSIDAELAMRNGWPIPFKGPTVTAHGLTWTAADGFTNFTIELPA